MKLEFAKLEFKVVKKIYPNDQMDTGTKLEFQSGNFF